MAGPFIEIAWLLLIAALVGAPFVRLHQPALIAPSVVGIGAGAGSGVVRAHDWIDPLFRSGVTVPLPRP